MGETSFNGEPPEWWREQTQALLAFRGASHSWIMELKYRDAETLDGVDLHVPTSIVHGASDQLSALAVGEDLNRRIAGSKLTVVERGSQVLPNTHPELIVEQIRARPRVRNNPDSRQSFSSSGPRKRALRTRERPICALHECCDTSSPQLPLIYS